MEVYGLKYATTVSGLLTFMEEGRAGQGGGVWGCPLAPGQTTWECWGAPWPQEQIEGGYRGIPWPGTSNGGIGAAFSPKNKPVGVLGWPLAPRTNARENLSGCTDGIACQVSPVSRWVLRELDFFFLRTPPRDHQPPTTNRHKPPNTTNRQPPTATNRQPPPTTNHQPPRGSPGLGPLRRPPPPTHPGNWHRSAGPSAPKAP